MNVSKLLMLSLWVVVVLVAGSGCAKKKDNHGAVNTSVTDIAPLSTSTPVSYTPAMTYEPAPVATTYAPAAHTGSYTVKKGDTLYGIARTQYGDGKQWSRIASANPGLSPQSLKVGQTIVVP